MPEYYATLNGIRFGPFKTAWEMGAFIGRSHLVTEALHGPQPRPSMEWEIPDEKDSSEA